MMYLRLALMVLFGLYQMAIVGSTHAHSTRESQDTICGVHTRTQYQGVKRQMQLNLQHDLGGSNIRLHGVAEEEKGVQGGTGVAWGAPVQPGLHGTG